MSDNSKVVALVRDLLWLPLRFLVLAVLICEGTGYAQSGPQPPCGSEPVPTYPSVLNPANVKLWSRAEFGNNWMPPACTNWTMAGFTTLVTIAARFHHAPAAEDLLRDIGAISGLTGTRYWSATHKQWQTLILDAHALTSAQGQRRANFSAGELKEGKTVFFEQADNLSGKGVYQMHVMEASADRIVFEIENVGTMRFHLIPVLHPGDMQSIYFLDREPDNVWRFYSMVRTGQNANHLIAGNESSAINRAAALYRHFAGIPTDQEPPAAR